jgi:RHS repeat-associated protein
MNMNEVKSMRYPLPRIQKSTRPYRLKKLSQSVMVALLSVSILMPHFEALALMPTTEQAVSEMASNLNNIPRASSQMTLQSSVVNNVKLPNAEYVESHIDIEVKVIGGYIKLERAWRNGRWYLNTTWANLRFIADPLDNSIKTIDRSGTLFERSGNTTLFSSGKVHIQKTDSGWRWHNNDGDWILYDSEGRMTSYGDRNGVSANLILDKVGRRIAVQDSQGATVYTFEYDDHERLTGVMDNVGRSVRYQWQGERLISVTDVLGNLWQYHYNNDGQITQRVEPDGGVVAIGYSYSMPAAKSTMVSGINAGYLEKNSVVTGNRTNSDSKVARVGRITDKSGAVTLYQSDYDKANQNYTITIDEPNGKQTVSKFNAKGETISVHVNGVLQSSVRRDGDKEVVTTDVRGLKTTVRYDVDKRPIQVIHTDGTSEFFEYDNQLNKLVRHVDVLGVVSVWQYDAKGNLVKQILAQGLPEQLVSLYDYDEQGLLITVSEEIGSETVSVAYSYDQAGNIETFTDGEGHVYRYQYNVNGNITALETPLGKVWQYDYDNAGQIIKQTDPLGHQTRFNYNPVGQLIEIIDPLGQSTHYQQELSKDRWAISETNPLGETRRVIYDLNQNSLQFVSAGGLSQHLQFDNDDHLLSVKDVTGYLTSFEYGTPGTQQASQVTAVNYPTFKERYVYDNAGRVIESKQYLDEHHALTTRRAYNAKGQLIGETRPGDRTMLYEYDSIGNRLTEIDALGATSSKSYIRRGQIETVTDAKGNHHRYKYDKNNGVIAEIMPTGERVQYIYNQDSLLSRSKDSVGNNTDYDYDDSQRLIKKIFTAAGELIPQQSVNYHYNATGNLLEVVQEGNSHSRFTYSLDALGRKVEESVTYGEGAKAFSFTLGYRYDRDGNLSALVYPEGSEVTFNRKNGLLEQVVLPNGKTTDWLDYHWFKPTTIRFPGSEQRIEYDALLRPVHNEVNASDSLLFEQRYSYNDAGLIDMISDRLEERRFDYDKADRLTQSLPSQTLIDMGMPIESYAYDTVGNRIGSSHQPGEWHYGDDNRLLQMGNGEDLTRFNYSASGNVTEEIRVDKTLKYTYDATDRLIKIADNDKVIASYSYDPFGRRISKTVEGVTTWYLYSDEGLIAELNDSGQILVAYGWQPDTLYGTAPLWQANLVAGQTLKNAQYHFLMTDHLGTPQIAVSQQGEVTWQGMSESFGHALLNSSNQITMNLRLPGQYYDAETGSHYNYFRYYNSQIGRYQQRDPIGLFGGINLYNYPLNPIQSIDPLGLYNPEKCESIRRRIENLEKEIWDKRYPDLANNPGSLPYKAWPGSLLRDSVQGHEILLTTALHNLDNAWKEWQNNGCDNPPPPSPSGCSEKENATNIAQDAAKVGAVAVGLYIGYKIIRAVAISFIATPVVGGASLAAP